MFETFLRPLYEMQRTSEEDDMLVMAGLGSC